GGSEGACAGGTAAAPRSPNRGKAPPAAPRAVSARNLRRDVRCSVDMLPSFAFPRVIAEPQRSDAGTWMAAKLHRPNPLGRMGEGRTPSAAWPLKLTYNVPPSALTFIP